jgi:hypothetical protein
VIGKFSWKFLDSDGDINMLSVEEMVSLSQDELDTYNKEFDTACVWAIYQAGLIRRQHRGEEI